MYSPYRSIRSSLAFAMLLTPVFSAISLPTFSQGARLEEVVVTARRRVESMQDTPIAVTAFSADGMRAAQINNLADLAQTVPGLSNTDGAKVSGLTIRGVGARVAQVKVDPGVGVYVDGVFMPRSDTQLVDVVDMESMQVLRGPQGTLFGKNTAGGAILMTSKKPTEDFEGQVELGLGNFDRQDFSVRVGGPLIEDTLFGALTYDQRKSDGYMDDNITGVDYGNIDRQAVVGQLRWVPTDSLIIDFIALWGETSERAAPRTCLLADPTALLQGLVAPQDETPYAEYCERSEALAEEEKVLMDQAPLLFEVTNNMAGLTVDWEIGELTLKSITGYLGQDGIEFDSDQDSVPLLAIGNFTATARQMSANGLKANDQERTFISQEFNLFGSAFDENLDYTLGIYGSDENIEDVLGGNSLSLSGYMGSPLADDVLVLAPRQAGFSNASLAELTGQSAAAFGQLIYYFSDMWQFTLGARYTWEEKEYAQNNYLSTAPGFIPGETGLVEFIIPREEFNELAGVIQPLIPDPGRTKQKLKDDWTEFSPSATVTMFAPERWTDGFLNTGMFYLTYSEGFKAGGFSEFGGDLFSFDPEIVKNTELGFKMDMFEHRVRLNGAIYSMDYDDMQLGVTRAFDTFNASFGITNAGDSVVEGVELEVVYLPLDGLLLSFTGSYIDAEYKEFIDEFTNDDGEQELTDRSDEPFQHLPEQTYSWVIQYDWDTDFGLITPRISGFYKDEVYTGQSPGAFEFEDVATLDSFTTWNARLAFQSSQLEGLEVALYVNNFTDEFYYGTGNLNDLLGINSVVAGKSRTYGVEFFYNW
ncbi:MAG: TonB-dependent receptor [Halioglobus sp.]